MIHFLDFDRTVFDTDSFLKELPNMPGCAPFREEILSVVSEGDTVAMDKGRHAVWNKVSKAIGSGELAFSPGELGRFVYPDAFEMLRSLGNEAIIITFGEVLRQKAKVESALANVVRVTVLYTGDTMKGEFLKTWPGYYGQEAIYADDRAYELEVMAKAFPLMRIFEMRRDQKEGDGRWPVIRTLNDLPSAV